MEIDEGICDINKEKLYHRVDSLVKQDKEHTAREHMKAILLRQIYNTAEDLYNERDRPIEYVLAENLGTGDMAQEFRDLAEKYTNKYFPEYKENKEDEEIREAAKGLEEVLLAKGRVNL